MTMEQGLYTQFVKLFLKYLKLIAENKDKNEAKFKFQGQYARSQSWFDLELYWIGVNFSTHGPDFYRNFFRSMRIHKTQIHLKYFKFQ